MTFVRSSTVISVQADLYANPQTTGLEIVFRRLLFRTKKAEFTPGAPYSCSVERRL